MLFVVCFLSRVTIVTVESDELDQVLLENVVEVYT